MSERNQGKNNEYDNGDLHTVCACGDDPASDPAINLPEAMQAITDTVHKSVGFTKNCFDLFNICITITVGLVCQGHLIGIGLGTVVAVIGVGRVIAIFNHGFKKKMDELAGMEA